MKKNYTIYFASSNKDKLKEVKSILYSEIRDPSSEIRDLTSDHGSKNSELAGRGLRLNIIIKNAPKGFKVNENGKTFLENAYKKASKLSKMLKCIAFSDDSGIEVFALNRKPGIKSSRFFRNGKGMYEIIEGTREKKNKKCCFTCALVVTDKNGKILFKTVKSWYGKVANKPMGKNGFGYDPIFIVPKLNKTSAQISPGLKNKLSHRSMAIRDFAGWIRNSGKF